MPPKAAKKKRGKYAAQSDNSDGEPPRKRTKKIVKAKPAEKETTTGKRKASKEKPSGNREERDEENDERLKPKKVETGESGPGIRVRLTVPGSAPVRLDLKAQALRSARKKEAKQKDTANPFPKYGKEKDTEQTAKFFSTISPQLSPTEDRKPGYYPLASSMPANRTKTWNKILVNRTCAVCGAWFHEGGADGQYTEHMRRYHPHAPRSNRHGLPRVPHQSLITEGKIVPREAWEAIARADADSRALFAALPGANAFYTREQVRPDGEKEFATNGDNPPPLGGHSFFPWDMEMLSRNNEPIPAPKLPSSAFRIPMRWRKDFLRFKEVIGQCTDQLVEAEDAQKPKGKGKGKAKASKDREPEDEDAVDPDFRRAMLALEAVIEFFVDEAEKYKEDKIRSEYIFRNLHLIMYQARVGFAAQLPEQDGEPESVQEARKFLKTLFKNTAPDDDQYAIPTPPGLPEGVKPAPAQQESSPMEIDEVIEKGDKAGEDYPAVDVTQFTDHMDDLHVCKDALLALDPQPDAEYTMFFERVANTIFEFHQEMSFNSKHTDEIWTNLEYARFRAIRDLRPELERHRPTDDWEFDAVADSRIWLETLFDMIDPGGSTAGAPPDSNDGSDYDQPDQPDNGRTDRGQSEEGQSDKDYSHDIDLNPGLYDDDDEAGPSVPPPPKPSNADFEPVDLTHLQIRLETHLEKLKRVTPPKGDKHWTPNTASCIPRISKQLRKAIKALETSGGDKVKETKIADLMRSGIAKILEIWVSKESNIMNGAGPLTLAVRGIRDDLKLGKKQK